MVAATSLEPITSGLEAGALTADLGKKGTFVTLKSLCLKWLYIEISRSDMNEYNLVSIAWPKHDSRYNTDVLLYRPLACL